jgi:hypothetical protein
MSKFFRGKSTLFDPVKHSDGLFFATDINELYVAFSDSSYRVYGSKEIITGIEFDSENAKLILTYRDNVIPVMTGEEITGYTNVAEVSLASLVNPVIEEATQDKSGLMSAEDKINLDTLVAAYENNELGKVQGIAEDDNILDLSEDGILSAAVSLSYDEKNKRINLVGKNDTNLGYVDASPFIVDGMLNDVEIVTEDGKKYIEFTWNVKVKTEVDGETVETTKTDRIAIEDIVIAYTAGNGIEISNTNEISVKAGSGINVDANGVSVKASNGIAVNSNGVEVKAGAGVTVDSNGVAVKLAEGTNYITLDNSGLKVNEIKAEDTVLKEDILIAGLGSSGIGAGIYKNGDTISAGTSIYEILSNILSKESYPNANNGKVYDPSFKTTYGTPSFSVKLKQENTDVSDKTVEVGTEVIISSVSGTAPTASGTRSYSGFTNGYATVDNNGDATIVKNQNPPSVSVIASNNVKDGTFTLSRSFPNNGFGQTTGSTSTSNVNYSGCSIESINVSVKEGTNKVTCTMTGPVHTGTITASPKYYVLSNKFNYKDVAGYYVDAKAANNNMTATVANGTSTKTVTGAFYYYIGFVNTIPTNVSVTGDSEKHATEAIKSLNDIEAKWCVSTGNTITNGGTLPGGKNMCIAVPSHYVLDSIMNGFDLESKDSFATSSVKYKLSDGTYQDYTIYSMNSAADWNFKTIKIKKA